MVMRAFHILYFLICLGAVGSCKPESTTNQETATLTTTPEGTASEAQSPQPSGEPAGALPPNSSGDPEGHDYTFLTHQLFHITGAYVPGKDPKEKPYESQWIDLDPNGTYKYGAHQKETYTGKWSYNHDIGTLLLRPNVTSITPAEWKVQHNDDMMVWVGTRTYGNNGIQLRLERKKTLPE